MKSTILLSMLFAALLPIGLGDTKARILDGRPLQDSDRGHGLKGTCIWQEVKYPTTSGEQQGVGPATILASINFNGDGVITLDYDVNINGIYSSANGISGSYSVDSAGHGSFTFVSPASNYQRTYDFRVSPNGHTIYTIAQSDGTGSVTQRVSAGSCSFLD